MTLANGNGTCILDIPCTYTVLHPLRPSVSSIFSGQLHPQQEWKYRVHFLRSDHNSLTVKSVVSSDPAVNTQLTESGELIVLVKSAKIGNGKAQLTINYSDSSVQQSFIAVDYIIGD